MRLQLSLLPSRFAAIEVNKLTAWALHNFFTGYKNIRSIVMLSHIFFCSRNGIYKNGGLTCNLWALLAIKFE